MSLKVIERATSTIFEVNGWPREELPFPVYTANCGRAIEQLREDDWSQSDLERINARRRSRRGDEKGRLLYAAEYLVVPKGWHARAVALLSAPPRRPLQVIHIVFALALSEKDRARATRSLLRAACAIAEQRSNHKVHWLVPPVDAGRLADLYGFRARGRKRNLRILEWNPR